MDAFTTQYIETALWASQDKDGTPLDKKYGVKDIHPKTLKIMEADCAAFQAANMDDIAHDLSGAGHDFWLTRNREGAGFWDGDWEEEAAKRLTEASQRAGERHLSVYRRKIQQD